MVDLILETATNGLAWARKRESERLDHEEESVERGPGDKNDEGYLIAELAEPLPTQLSIIKTILMLQSQLVGSDEENIVRFKALLSVGKSQRNSFLTLLRCVVTFTRLVGWHGTSRAKRYFGITGPHCV
jgi:hypothetical protein